MYKKHAWVMLSLANVCFKINEIMILRHAYCLFGQSESGQNNQYLLRLTLTKIDFRSIILGLKYKFLVRPIPFFRCT